MPWNWQGRGSTSTELGGTRGSYEEAKIAHAWPNYEAEYLAKRLEEGGGKYAKGPGGKAPTEIASFVYYDKVTDDYKQEADECLKKEFNQWLAGEHPDNDKRTLYENAAGKPVRKAVYREKGEEPGQPLKNEWRPTHWGKAQLTHLPGVREYLREQSESAAKNEFAMNLLAEHGPQNLEEAWMYFKHWVKGRPVGPEICMTLRGTPGYKSIAGRIPPDNEKSEIISGYHYPEDRVPTPMEMSDAAENTATKEAGSSTRVASVAEEALRETVKNLQEKLRTGETAYEDLRNSTYSQETVHERFQEGLIMLNTLRGELNQSEQQFQQFGMYAETQYQQLMGQAGVEIQNLQRENLTLEAQTKQMEQGYRNYIQFVQSLAEAEINMQREELAKQRLQNEAVRLEKEFQEKAFAEFEKQMQDAAAEQQAALEDERLRLIRLNASADALYAYNQTACPREARIRETS